MNSSPSALAIGVASDHMGVENIASIQKYRIKAAEYDESAAFTMGLRREAIASLDLSAGQVVIDVGSDTGLSIPLLLG